MGFADAPFPNRRIVPGAHARCAGAGLLMLALGTVACDAQGPVAAESAGAMRFIEEAIAGIDSTELKQRIGVIAHDSMSGRATPSRGLNLTAGWIAAEFERFGLQPGIAGGFIQRYYPRGEDSPSAPNVIAILPGSDPELRDSYVVFSAHMDHVGTGVPDASGDSIYNGADDDASGTAAVIEIAQAFASLRPAPARSIAFLTVSGEEGGLWGSRAFVTDGPIETRNIVADINMDMIGRNAPDTVVAIGLRYSDLGPRILQIAERNTDLGLTVIDDPWPDERFFFRSDHYNFASAGVPAIFLFAGTHADYHRPSDEVERIDASKAARIARLAFRLGLDIASDANEPAWTPEGLNEVRPANRN
jgi:hypothetical protein